VDLDQDSGTPLAFDPANGRERGRIQVGPAAHFAATPPPVVWS
jgi:hypothetical protein